MEQITKRFMNWASILEEDTKAQAQRTSEMPFIYPHLALMPDAHLGKGATVGSVIPTEHAIMPAAVGVDIGCGMIAVRTQWTEAEFRDMVNLPSLRQKIEHVIPLSAGGYNTSIYSSKTDSRIDELASAGYRPDTNVDNLAPNWRYQLGSLGSGNHFIEVSVDEEKRVWLFLHSGSRGVGNKLAQKHIRVAQQVAEKYFIKLPDPDLAYLVENTPEFWHYIHDLNWAQHFALLNREEMMDRVIEAVQYETDIPVIEEMRINCHHNYTTSEKVYGRDVWLSRKGAIDAHKGVMGLIPGSMGTASYVVEGKGNHLALNSSPHGAGREYSRSQARKTFTFAELEQAMEGIEWRRTAAFLDEIPGAYKDIDVVMHDAADLVTVKHTLHQILNVKGD